MGLHFEINISQFIMTLLKHYVPVIILSVRIYSRAQITQTLFVLMALAFQVERQTINVRNNSFTVCLKVMSAVEIKQRKGEQSEGS